MNEKERKKTKELIVRLKKAADIYVEKKRKYKASPQNIDARISFLEAKISMQGLKIEILKEELKNFATKSGWKTIEFDF